MRAALRLSNCAGISNTACRTSAISSRISSASSADTGSTKSPCAVAQVSHLMGLVPDKLANEAMFVHLLDLVEERPLGDPFVLGGRLDDGSGEHDCGAMCADALALMSLAGRRSDVLGHVWVLTPDPDLGNPGPGALRPAPSAVIVVVVVGIAR